ncbi:hypothetical protein V8F06_010581 [Rhypophila decipiens]
MLLSSFPAMLAPLLFATQATCAIPAGGAINRYNELKRQAEQTRTSAANLGDLACVGNSGYAALAEQVEAPDAMIDPFVFQLEDSTPLTDDDPLARDVFNAFYKYSEVLCQFLAVLATKSCLPTGVVCAILPTTARDAIKASELAGAFEHFMPDA